jgi:uncharacterized protein YggU (UPF0235/DUF167 family)
MDVTALDYANVFRKSTRGPSKNKGWELTIRLSPKASHTKLGEIAIDEEGQGYLKVYVTAVPEDNKANKALLSLLSKMFKIPKSSLDLISGHTDRRKVVWFEGDDCPCLR